MSALEIGWNRAGFLFLSYFSFRPSPSSPRLFDNEEPQRRPAGREIALLPKSAQHDAGHQPELGVDPQGRGAAGSFAVQTRVHASGGGGLGGRPSGHSGHADSRRDDNARSPGSHGNGRWNDDDARHSQHADQTRVDVDGGQHFPILPPAIPAPILSANQVISGQNSYARHPYTHSDHHQYRHRYKL